MHWFAAPRPSFTAPKPRLAVFRKKRDPLAPVRSKHTFSVCFLNLFSLKSIGLLRLGPALLRLNHTWPFSARNAIRSRLCGCFLTLFSVKSIGLLCLGTALLRLNHTWSFSARNAIRSRLCGQLRKNSDALAPRPCFALPRPCFALPRPCFDASRLCFCSPRTAC